MTAPKTAPSGQWNPGYVKHPLLGCRLRVIDTFAPTRSVSCPVCVESSVTQISIVESEYPGGVRYYRVACDECDDPNWVVFLD